MGNPLANRRPHLAVDSMVRWLDEVAAGPILLAVTIVATVATIARLA